MKKTFLPAMSSLLFAVSALAAPARLPESSYLLPESRDAVLQDQATASVSWVAEDAMLQPLDHFYSATLRALESSTPALSTPDETSANANRPKDWAPWHMEMFTTDLTVSAQGLIGALTGKGSPSVQLYWRRQGQKPAVLAPEAEAIEPAASDSGVVQVSPEMSTAELLRQVEPAVRAAIAAGRIQDSSRLRDTLRDTSERFIQVVRVLDTTAPQAWWVSGFRIDLTLDAQGNPTPAPIIGFGGDMRLRFEWKRMRRVQPAGPRSTPLAVASGLEKNLRDFVAAVSSDLASASAGLEPKQGFKAYAFRVGVGISAKGDIGFAKGSASLLGHMNFSSDAKKPTVYPHAPAAPLALYSIIENSAPASHLRLAVASDVQVQAAGDQAVFKLAREKIRAGMAKALRIGMKLADHSGRARSAHWKLWALKTGFDLSLTGDVGVVGVGGLAATEVSFYNMNF